MCRYFFCLLLSCWGIATSAFGVETGEFIVDQLALQNGKPGVSISLEIRTEQGVITQAEDLSFQFGDEKIPIAQIEPYGDVWRLSAFQSRRSWPDAMASGESPVFLMLGEKRLIHLGTITNMRALVHSGASLILTAPEEQSSLRNILWADYVRATSQITRKKFNWVASADQNDPAGAWRDLGFISYKRGKFREAAWCFFKASELDEKDPLSLAWLARTVRHYASADEQRLKAIEARLTVRLLAAQKRAAQESDRFSTYQSKQIATIKELQKSFDKTKSQLNNLAEAERNSEKADALVRRLDEFNKKIDETNTALTAKLAEVKWVTPFMIKQTFELDMAISKLPGEDEGTWVKKAKTVAELPYARSYNPLPVNRALRARAMLRLAAISDIQGRREQKAYKDDPRLKQQDKLKVKLKTLESELDLLKERTARKLADINNNSEIKNLIAIKENQKQAYETAKTDYERITQPLRNMRTQISSLRARGDNKKANALVPKYNAMLDKFKPAQDRLNMSVKAANAADKAYVEAYNKQADQISQAYSQKQNVYNKMIKQYNDHEKALSQMPYRDLIYNRDQYLALAKDEIYKGLTNRPTNELNNLLSSTESLIPLKKNADIFYTKRPWCASISFNCSTCYGLAVLNCSFAEMDAQSACQRGERVTMYSTSIPGNGGIIGACRGIRISKPNKLRWQESEISDQSEFISTQDQKGNEVISDAINDALSPLFDNSCDAGGSTQNPTSSIEDPEEGGLVLQFSQETLNALKKAHDKWQADQKHKFLLEDMARRLELIKQNQNIFNDPDIKKIIKDLEKNPDQFADKKIQKLLAEAVSRRAQHIIKSSIAEGGSQKDWVKKAKDINDIAKQANKIAKDLGGEIPGLKTLTGYNDNALEIIEGGKNGDANKIMSGIRGLTADVPGPLTATLEIPGRMVAGHVTHMSDTLKGEADVIGTVSEIIGNGGSDPAQDKKLAAQIKKVQDKLTPKSFIKHMFIDPMRDFFKNKIPGGETLLNLFDRFNQSDSPPKSHLCVSPPINFPED